MQIGIVGLPFSGKSTLFQTITKKHLDSFSLFKKDTHHTVVKIPDERLDILSSLFSPKRTVFATIEFVDVVGLNNGDSDLPQFSSNFLSNVKTNDAFVQVVRMFSNEAVPHIDGTLDVLRDISTFETEIILSDLLIIETRIERIKKQLKKSNNKVLESELLLLEKCHTYLENGNPLRKVIFSKEEMNILKAYQLLSMKPMLIALNLDETQFDDAYEYINHVSEIMVERNTKVVSFFGKIEREMSELTEEDANVFMAEYNIKESALNILIRESYALLGLLSFFTVGEDECRAWTIKNGMNAQEAAGVIHSDFIDTFIRAEVVAYDHFIATNGSFAKMKESGHWRLEGKEYVIKDGDIITIRHS